MIDLFRDSALVVAHPDDENLWFSSIIDKVDRVMVCYLKIASQPGWTEGREKSRQHYPLPNITWLEMTEAEVFDKADWENPQMTPYGLEVSQSRQYKKNYGTLKTKLHKLLHSKRTVFTHNPWGEYGHEDHVQVYRVLKDLQKEMHFDLWYNNVCSNKTIPLMLQHPHVFQHQWARTVTNKKLAGEIKLLYETNGCWTWFNDWEWLDEDVLIKDASIDLSRHSYGGPMPLHMIHVDLSGPIKTQQKSWINKLKGTVYTLLNALYRK